MALTYELREDGQERAAVPVWVHLTKEQVATIEHFADSAGSLSWRELLRKMAEEAIEKAIISQGKDLPVDRVLWADRRARPGGQRNSN